MIYLGIDAGGSTCRARLADETGKVLGEAKTGAANWRLGLEAVTASIQQATQAALQQAGLEDLPLKQLHAGIGMAGLVLESDYQAVQPLAELFAACRLTHDAYIACLGAHQGEEGGIAIFGTGSCGQIITAQESRTFGGWGFAIADQGSGAALGRAAVRTALQALETLVPASALTDAINQQFNQQASHYLTWSISAKPADYAKFAPLVVHYAEQDDAHARQILQGAIQEVLRYIQALQRYNTGRIALMGGLAETYQRLLPLSIRAELVQPQADALAGALLLARGQVPH